MKRTLAAAFVLAIAASTSAFAGGIGRAGTYGPQWSAGDSNDAPKTRAEVKAELVDAYRDGTLPALNKTSYPSQGLVGSTQAERLAIQEDAGDNAARVARAGQ